VCPDSSGLIRVNGTFRWDGNFDSSKLIKWKSNHTIQYLMVVLLVCLLSMNGCFFLFWGGFESITTRSLMVLVYEVTAAVESQPIRRPSDKSYLQ
jgi:hypothetical protein